MKCIKKMIALSFLYLLLLVVNAHAGLEPFYKGEWGMTPREIQKLYGYAPFDTYADDDTKSVYNRYQLEIDDHLVIVNYTFRKTLFSQKLAGVYFEFLFDNDRFAGLSLAELEALTAKLAHRIHNPAEPFTYAGYASVHSGFATWYSRDVWRNQTTVAEMTAVYFEQDDGVNIASLHAIFYNAESELAQTRYQEVLEEIAGLRQKDKLAEGK